MNFERKDLGISYESHDEKLGVVEPSQVYETSKNPENKENNLGSVPPIELHVVDEDQLPEFLAEHAGRVVMVRHFKDSYASFSNENFIVSQVAIPYIGEGSACCEVLLAPEGEDVHLETIQENDGGATEIVRFGSQNLVRLIVPEEYYQVDGEDGAGLEGASYAAYNRIFDMQNERDLGDLVRLTNFVPRVLANSQLDLPVDLESFEPTVEQPVRYTSTAHFTPYKQGEGVRYVRFNAGRYRAWEEKGPWQEVEDKGVIPFAPAATGIGAKGGPLVIEAWFAQEPVNYVYNDRQSVPYQYSREVHGKKPPIFSRATIWERDNGTMAVISGTASLLGSDVVYSPYAPVVNGTSERDMDYLNFLTVQNQAYLALDNIAHLLSASNLEGQGIEAHFSLLDITSARVYVKYPEHLDALKKIVSDKLPNAELVFVEDDICRDGWLLEIEAMAWKSK